MALTSFAQPVYSAEQIAQMATAMMDGDECLRIVTKRAADKLIHRDDRDPWAAGDNYDVDAKVFERVKKTMLRLQTLAPSGTGLNLWLKVTGDPKLMQVAIRLAPGDSSFFIGQMTQTLPAEFAQVFAGGTQATVQIKPGLRSVLSPVHNSLGDVTAVIEVTERIGRAVSVPSDF